jgi:hypothetical protein
MSEHEACKKNYFDGLSDDKEKKIIDFINDIHEVYKKHNMGITDYQGICIGRYHEDDIKELFGAYICKDIFDKFLPELMIAKYEG